MKKHKTKLLKIFVRLIFITIDINVNFAANALKGQVIK